MAFNKDEILAAWDAAVDEVARKPDDPTDDEIAAASAIVCAKLGVEPDDIRESLRAGLEELQGKVAAADRALKILKWIVPEEEKRGTLPGLPGGPPLKR